MSGARSYHAGLSAEDAVARYYEQHGYELLHRRWRGEGGEIDLILQGQGCIIFVEVKQSRSTATAASHLGARQSARILRAAQGFLALQPGGLDTPSRIDAALVDGQGRIEIVENALQG